MQNRQSRKLIDPQAILVQLCMPGAVKLSRFYGVNRGAVDAIGRECAALKSVQNSFSGERFDHARGIPNVKQV